MDPLSVSSGVAGLLSLAIQVGMTVAAYTNSVQGASKSAQKLEREIQAFSSVLKQLSEFLQSKDANHIAFEPTSVLLVATNSCDKELSDLQKKLEKFSKGDKASRILQKLSWPFTEKENGETIDTIHRWTQLYSLSLQTAGW
jgi:vacuolar-type H+-ATPase subunit I/STV1